MRVEQRTNLKLWVWLDRTPSETLTLLQQVYKKDVMSRSGVFEWHKRFKEGREDFEDYAKKRRTDAKVNRVRQMIRGDRRLTI